MTEISMLLASYATNVMDRIAGVYDHEGKMFVSKVFIEDERGTWILEDRDDDGHWTLRKEES